MTDIDLKAYMGKKVTFQYRHQGEGELLDMEGQVMLVNGPAMLFKPKGSAMQKLIELAHIDQQTFQQVTEAPRELKARELPALTLTNARHHLLDRHGYELAAINAMTDEAAFREHEMLDHDRLGHYHTQQSASEEPSDER